MNNTTFVRAMVVGVPVIIITSALVIFGQYKLTHCRPITVVKEKIVEVPAVAQKIESPTAAPTLIKPDVTTSTDILSGEKATKYTDNIADFSIAVPPTWEVEYGVDVKDSANTSTYFIISEPIVDTFRPFPKIIFVRSTLLPFYNYLTTNPIDPELPKLEFYDVHSYKFKGMSAIHWEQDTHLGIPMIRDFILRKYKKYNVVIEQNEGSAKNEEELKEIINSLEL